MQKDDEVFFSFKDNISAKSEGCNISRDICTSFGSILALCRDPLSSGFSMPAVMGEVVMRQTHESDKETVLTFEDPTGYALLCLLNCSVRDFPKALGDYIVVGNMRFSLTEIDGVDMVAASVDFSDVKLISMSEETKVAHKKRFSDTKIESYQFANPLLHS